MVVSFVKIKHETYEEIFTHYLPVPPEQGGIIGMKDGVICEYIHDDSRLEMDEAIYMPNTSFLNECINKWANEGIVFYGIIHSHPNGQKELSSGDIEYIEKLYQNNSYLERLCFPLVVGDDDMVVYITDMVDGQILIRKAVVEIVD